MLGKYAATTVLFLLAPILTSACELQFAYTSEPSPPFLVGENLVPPHPNNQSDVYLELDLTRLSDAWTVLGSQPNFSTPFFGHDKRLGVMSGFRHQF